MQDEDDDNEWNKNDMQTYCLDDHLDSNSSRFKNMLMILCAISTCLIYTLHYLQQPGEQYLYTFQVEHFINSDLSSKFKSHISLK